LLHLLYSINHWIKVTTDCWLARYDVSNNSNISCY